MVDEPVAGQCGGLLERAGLLEQVGGTGHDGQPGLAPHPGLRPPVELQHHGVPATDHQQGRRPYLAQSRRRQIGAAPAADHRGHLRVVSGGPQRRRRAGAGPEVPDRQPPASAVVPHPGRHRGQPPGQQLDVEHVPAVAAPRPG